MLNCNFLSAQGYIESSPTTKQTNALDKYEMTMDEVNSGLESVERFTNTIWGFVEYAEKLQQVATIAAMLTQDQNTSSNYTTIANLAGQIQQVAAVAQIIEQLVDNSITMEGEASSMPLADLFALADVNLPDISQVMEHFDSINIDIDADLAELEAMDETKLEKFTRGIKGAYTPSSYAIDFLSQDNYSTMVSLAKTMTIRAIIAALAIHTMENVIVGEAKSISEMSNGFQLIENNLRNFVTRSSMNYIEFKYPLIPSIGYTSNNTFGNYITRERFRSKLNAELEYMETYVDADNPIAEDERLYLILDSIEKTIKTTLENEGL